MNTQTTTAMDSDWHVHWALHNRFGRWVRDNFGQDGNAKDLENLAKAVSYALGMKHTVLDLSRVDELHDNELYELLKDIDIDKALPFVENYPPSQPLLRSPCGRYVWMQRYFRYEQLVASMLHDLASKANALQLDTEVLDDVFDGSEKSEGQKQAVKLACMRRVAVITGGPGTGKTWTVANLIQVLLKSNPDTDIRIELAAPTGKASFRVMESLKEAAEGLKIDLEKLPQKALTLHKLLRYHPNAAHPGHNAANPLALDVLIIDEASMVDLPMMAMVLDALPSDASLVLLGDKDQLSSVSAGNIMSDLCSVDSPLQGSGETSLVATLSYNHRSKNAPGIGEWADAVNSNDPESLTDNENVTWRKPSADKAREPDWLNMVVTHYTQIKEAIKNGSNPGELLEQQLNLQTLCALNRGPYGVAGINSMVARELGQKPTDWKAGLPVMITSNDHSRNLFNGDVGLVLPVCEDETGKWFIDKQRGKKNLRACFPGPAGKGDIKAIALAQMPAWEPCYAMTVHKSQGSEYRTVVLVLPADDNEHQSPRVLTRELVYTGVTRAKKKVIVSAGKRVMQAALDNLTTRMSGLAEHARRLKEEKS